MKDKTTAAIFALLLGGLGTHHFYLGNKGRGILYLLFCWTFIPSFVALIEGITLLSTDDNQFHLVYNPQFIDHSLEDAGRLENLKRLHELRATGAISDVEYDQEKKKYIA